MSWEKVKLKEITEYITDGDHQPAPKAATGVRFIKIKDIKDNRICFDNCLFVPADYYESLPSNRKPQKGDTLYTVVGSYGLTAFVNDLDPFCFERNIALLHPNQKVVPKFLFYLLSNPAFYKQADNIANGSAQKLIPLSKLSNMEVHIPAVKLQEHIADILSAYDDLIENNQKQIKLLEEAAQRLYKEWFVDLHFPGWENANITDGVPEGWHEGTLSELAEFKRGKTITKAQVEEGPVPVVAGGLEPAYYHNAANTKKPVITVSGSGANAGFTRLYHTEVYASDCSYVDSDRTDYLEFVYCFLTDNVAKLDSLQKGSAQPHVYAKDINALVLCIPSKIVLQRFCGILRHFYDKIGCLEKQNTALKEARDRLLPKLMSGELEV